MTVNVGCSRTDMKAFPQQFSGSLLHLGRGLAAQRVAYPHTIFHKVNDMFTPICMSDQADINIVYFQRGEHLNRNVCIFKRNCKCSFKMIEINVGAPNHFKIQDLNGINYIFRLYISLTCPYSQRVWIARNFKVNIY